MMNGESHSIIYMYKSLKNTKLHHKFRTPKVTPKLIKKKNHLDLNTSNNAW
jgi:hypothetical protein